MTVRIEGLNGEAVPSPHFEFQLFHLTLGKARSGLNMRIRNLIKRVEMRSQAREARMDVLFLLFFFGFIALSIWLGYLAYKVLKKRRERQHGTIEQQRREL